MDHEFVSYIHKKDNQYEEGENINTDLLMLQADNKKNSHFKCYHSMTDPYKEDPHWCSAIGSLAVDEDHWLIGLRKMSKCLVS